METGEGGYSEGLHEEATTREEGLGANLVDDETITEESFEDDPGKRIVFWADKAIKDYFDIFKNPNLPRHSKKEKKVVANHVDKIAQEIVDNPSYIQEGAYLWLLYDQEEDKDKDKDDNQDEDKEEENQHPSFYEKVREAAGKKIKKNAEKGKELPHETLAGIISASVNSDEANEFADHLLESYFVGHQGMRSRVDAMYNLSMAGYDLLEDRAALEKAIRIRFWDTDIVKRGSGFFKDVNTIKSTGVDDEEALRKELISNLAMGSLIIHAGIEDFNQINEKNQKSATENDAIIKSEDYKRRAISRIGIDKYNQRITQLSNFYKSRILSDEHTSQDKDEYDKLLESSPWIIDLINRDDPLAKKNKEINYLNSSKVLEKIYKEYLQKERIDSALIHKTIIAANEDRFELYLADSEESEDLNKRISEIVRELVDKEVNFQNIGSALSLNTYTFDPNFNAIYFRRPKSEFEKDLHPISAISEIGFIDVDEEKKQETEEMAEYIKDNQLRFLNKRGVMIPTDGTVLEDLGYTGFQFNKGDSSQEIKMTVHYANEAYSVKMDKNFNFMLEGKDADPNTLYSLQYVALKMLKPVLCEQSEESLSLDQSAGKEAVSRMSHLRLLPEGYHYTQEAVKNCFELEGRDLRTIDASRKAKGEKRDTTYVRPIIEKDEDLPPAKITIPDLSL